MILSFIVITLSGQDVLTQKVLSKHEGIITSLSRFLPGFDNFSPFSSLSAPTNIKWPSFSKPVVLSTMMCLANIAACSNSTYIMLKYNILGWYVAFSAYEDPDLRADVAICLFNSVTNSS